MYNIYFNFFNIDKNFVVLGRIDRNVDCSKNQNIKEDPEDMIPECPMVLFLQFIIAECILERSLQNKN